MAIEPILDDGARSLLFNALAQNDVDMGHHKLLNLDTSNLPPSGIPPTIVPPAHNWLKTWDSPSRTWGVAQPDFIDLSGNLTRNQQRAISQTGTITSGAWQATPIGSLYLPTLDGIRPPVANVGLNNKKITGLADPVDDQDAVNRRFIDILFVNDIKPKAPVRIATTGDIRLAGITAQSGLDGVTPVVGDRVLVKNQLNNKQNGIYVVDTGFWPRSTDADAAAEVTLSYCVVLEGTVNQGSAWVENLTVTTLGIYPAYTGDPVNYVLFSQSSSIGAGAGLQKVGNLLNVLGTAHRIVVGTAVDIAGDYAGQTSIVTVGTIGNGTWEGNVIDAAHGGTGVSNPNGNNIQLDLPLTILNPAGGLLPGLTLRTSSSSSDLTLPQSGKLATLDGPETFTNKTIVKKTSTTASASTPVINPDVTDIYTLTALAVNASFDMANFSAPSGGDHGHELEILLKDNGVGHNLAWSAKFTASAALPLPTILHATGWMYLKFIYNLTSTKWMLTIKLEDIV